MVWVGHVFCNDCLWIVPFETQRPLQSWRKGVHLKHLSAPSIFSLFGWLEAGQWKQLLLNTCKSRRFFTKTLITASLQSDSPQRIDALIDHMSAHTVTDYGAGKKTSKKLWTREESTVTSIKPLIQCFRNTVRHWRPT